MLGYVSLAIVAGLVLGMRARGSHADEHRGGRWTDHGGGLPDHLPDDGQCPLRGAQRAGRNVRGIGIALFFNFVWAPIIGWLLAAIFLPDPLLALGFLLVMVVPCSSMAIGYTGLAKGDLELGTVVVALSFVLAIVAVPLWMTLFASNYALAVPIGNLDQLDPGWSSWRRCCLAMPPGECSCGGWALSASRPLGRSSRHFRCWACTPSSS